VSRLEWEIFVNRVALVLGGTRGIGLAAARALADAGCRVAVTTRDATADHPLDGEFLVVGADVTDTDSIDAAFTAVEAQLGAVEVLVANAGITRDGLAVRMSDDDFAAVVDTNLTGTFRACRRALPKMMRARWGRIVVVGSVVGSAGQAGQANYAAAKAGLVGLARSLAREFASRSITVNVVAPGPIETDMLAALGDSQRAAIESMVPLGRTGTPEEVAAAIAFLSSDLAGYITGVVLGVDGGLSMGS
jgi:3-oxoacyl-[acyl-carrier protein] reductase